jgi:hypothetical protein
MAFPLPTDTQHLQLETRQYELFNRPLGQGIVRRRLYLGAAVCVVWFTVLLVVGLNPLSRLGPALFIVPPFAIVYMGTRIGDDGRMTAVRSYDAVLARLPSRRQRIGNPLLASATQPTPTPIRIDGQMTELHPLTGSGPLRPLVGRRGRSRSVSGGDDR